MSKSSTVVSVEGCDFPAELPLRNTEDFVNMLVKDYLQKFHTEGKNPDLDQRVEAAYEKIKGVPFFKRDKVQQSMALGYPGHGKTTAFKIAAEEVAKLLDLNLKINPGEREVITKNDLVLISFELAGEAYNGSIIGLPRVDQFKLSDGETQDFTTSIPPRRLALTSESAATVVLFDDALNASPNVQNVCLSIAEEGRYRGVDLNNAYVGFTGNLGALDGTHVTLSSNALVTRLKVLGVHDTCENWIKRTKSKFTGPGGDGGIAGFLMQHPEFFHVPHAKGTRDRTPYPTPRSWSYTANHAAVIGREIHEIQSTKGAASKEFMDAQLNELIYDNAELSVGKKAASNLKSYMHSLYTSAQPLAYEAIHGDVTKKGVGKSGLTDESQKLFNERIGTGHSNQQQTFGHQYVMSVAEIGAHRFAEAFKSGDPDKIMSASEAIGRALMYQNNLTDDLISRGLTHLVEKLPLIDRSMLQEKSEVQLETKTVLTPIAKGIRKTPRGLKNYREFVVQALSGAANHADIKSVLGIDDDDLDAIQGEKQKKSGASNDQGMMNF